MRRATTTWIGTSVEAICFSPGLQTPGISSLGDRGEYLRSNRTAGGNRLYTLRVRKANKQITALFTRARYDQKEGPMKRYGLIGFILAGIVLLWVIPRSSRPVFGQVASADGLHIGEGGLP